MALFENKNLKYLRGVVDDATYNLSVLSDSSITPELLQEYEAKMQRFGSAATLQGKRAEVVQILEAARTQVRESQGQTWNGIINRVLAGLG